MIFITTHKNSGSAIFLHKFVTYLGCFIAHLSILRVFSTILLYEQVILVVIMIKKILLFSFIVFCYTILFNIQIIAKTDLEKTPFQRVLEINSRITPEVLEQFAQERELKYIEVKNPEKLQEKLNKSSYFDFTFPEQELIGRTLLKEFLSDHKLYTSDPLMVRYVASVGKLVASAIGDQEGTFYTFGVINDPTVRIYTFPGGYIFVTSGFLKTLQNEAQLAASLAREITSIEDNYLMNEIISNEEAFTLLSSLKRLLTNKTSGNVNQLTAKEQEEAKEYLSDPFNTLDYYASPSIKNTFDNKDFITRKLLKKLFRLVPPYEVITKKDLIALQALKETGYDAESTKDMILTLNKQQQQNQVINRTINIENWLGADTLRKHRANKIEGRYVMMIERLNY